jgi:hypothetical protein
MTTQHKWLPSEPTADMHTAYYSVRQVSLNVDSYKAMWQAAPEVEQEPVGRVVNISYPESSDNTKYLTATITDASRCKAGDYLYTNPQPKRKPLSEENLVLIWNSSTKDIPYEHFQAVFRFAEKAHGIGVE